MSFVDYWLTSISILVVIKGSGKGKNIKWLWDVHMVCVRMHPLGRIDQTGNDWKKENWAWKEEPCIEQMIAGFCKNHHNFEPRAGWDQYLILHPPLEHYRPCFPSNGSAGPLLGAVANGNDTWPYCSSLQIGGERGPQQLEADHAFKHFIQNPRQGSPSTTQTITTGAGKPRPDCFCAKPIYPWQCFCRPWSDWYR